MKFASFRPQVETLEGRLQPGSIFGLGMLSDGLGILDQALHTGLEETAGQGSRPALTATQSVGTQAANPAASIEIGTPIIANNPIQASPILQPAQVLDSHSEALQNFLPGSIQPVQADSGSHTRGANIVCDGGFEAGMFDPCWWPEGNFTSVSSTLVHSGNFAAQLGPTTEGRIAQILTTTAGQHYTLDYWLLNEGGGPNSFKVLFDGELIPGSVITEGPIQPYTHYTFDVVGSHEVAGLEFYTLQVPNYWHLDDVSVRAVG